MAGDTKESEIVKSLRNVPGRTLLLFGNKGSGKLALCNKLAGRQVFNESYLIEKSPETTFLCIGQKGSEDEKISLINTPDLDPNDKEGNTKVIANVLAKIKTGCDFVNLIGICLDRQASSLDESHTSVLHVLREIFGEVLSTQCILIITSSSTEEEIDNKEMGCTEKLEHQLTIDTLAEDDDKSLHNSLEKLENMLEMTKPLRMPLRVLAYNVWGMPSRLGDKDKGVRMVALAEMFSSRLDFDIILLSELWLQKDHELIKKKVGKKQKWKPDNCCRYQRDFS